MVKEWLTCIALGWLTFGSKRGIGLIRSSDVPKKGRIVASLRTCAGEFYALRDATLLSQNKDALGRTTKSIARKSEQDGKSSFGNHQARRSAPG